MDSTDKISSPVFDVEDQMVQCYWPDQHIYQAGQLLVLSRLN